MLWHGPASVDRKGGKDERCYKRGFGVSGGKPYLEPRLAYHDEPASHTSRWVGGKRSAVVYKHMSVGGGRYAAYADGKEVRTNMLTRPVRYAENPQHAMRAFFFCAAFLGLQAIGLCPYAGAEVTLSEADDYILTTSPFLRTDVIMLENTVDLDTKQRDDRFQTVSADYSLAFDFKIKNEGPQVYLKLERNAIYDYDAPLVIHNTLNTYVGKVSGYCNAELLPKIKEYWADLPIAPDRDIRLKAGLFKYQVGHGIALGGSYQNYGIELYAHTEQFEWNIYTCWPDYANKPLLGPYIKQEKPEGVDYEHSKAYFVSTDVKVSTEHITAQPYVGMLMDFSDTRRLNFFQTPTNDDILGTVGIAWDFELDRFSFGVEWARNFGRANSSEADFPDVEHRGYAVYADAKYEFGNFVPHSYVIYTSGNKLTTDMITNGDTVYPGSKNNAFSVYSPMNGYLADSIYPGMATMPLVATGNGWGINYGVRRPTTFGDPGLMENLTLFGLGFDHVLMPKATLTCDWWYLSNPQKGIGLYNGIPKVISTDIGNEVDVYFSYDINKSLKINVLSGIFFPGAAYREERTDTGGSLFTPFVRGDGKADPAYQFEINMEMSF